MADYALVAAQDEERRRKQLEEQQRKQQQKGSYFPAANRLQQIAQQNLAKAEQQISQLNQIRNPQQTTTGTIFDPRTGAGQYAAGYQATPQNLVTYTLPSGGTVSVPAGTKQPSGSVVGQSARLGQPDLQAAYQRGYGAPQPTVGGGYVGQRGVQTPAELLTPQQRSQYGVAGTPYQRITDPFTTNPALAAVGRGISQIAGLFRGNPQYAMRTSPYSAPSRPPRRYFDYE